MQSRREACTLLCRQAPEHYPAKRLVRLLIVLRKTALLHHSPWPANEGMWWFVIMTYACEQVAADEAAMQDAEPATSQPPPKRLKLDTSGVGKVPILNVGRTPGHALKHSAVPLARCVTESGCACQTPAKLLPALRRMGPLL